MPISPYSGRDCVKSLPSSYTGLNPPPSTRGCVHSLESSRRSCVGGQRVCWRAESVLEGSESVGGQRECWRAGRKGDVASESRLSGEQGVCDGGCADTLPGHTDQGVCARRRWHPGPRARNLLSLAATDGPSTLKAYRISFQGVCALARVLSRIVPLGEPWTLNPAPSTLNPEPWTLNPQPCTLNPEP